MARTPVLPEAILVGALSAQQRMYAAAICYVRFASICDIPLFVSNSQIAAIAEGRAEWVKPTPGGEFAVGRRPTARGAKAAVARDVASIQTAALNAMIRHRLDPESLGIVGRSMANRLA